MSGPGVNLLFLGNSSAVNFSLYLSPRDEETGKNTPPPQQCVNKCLTYLYLDTKITGEMHFFECFDSY